MIGFMPSSVVNKLPFVAPMAFVFVNTYYMVLYIISRIVS